MRARTLAVAGFLGAAAAGTALGFVAERAAVRRPDLDEDPDTVALRDPPGARRRDVLSADGTRLAVEVVGPDVAPTIVLAHGYGLAQRLWNLQRNALSERYRVVTYDQRGHGGSATAATGDWSAEALGEDLRAVLQTLVPPGRRAVVAGHSMGGMAIMALAAEHPDEVRERIAGAVLMSTAAGRLLRGASLSVGAATVQAVQQRIFASGYRRMGVTRRDQPTSGSTDLSWLLTRGIALNNDASPAHVAFIERMLLDTPNSVRSALGSTVTGISVEQGLENLAVPTLVVVGTADRLTPARHAGRMAEVLDDGTLIELDGVGHTPMLEASGEVTAHLATFAQRLLADDELAEGA